ncbi:MAG: leucine-rich repeat protein [Corallococcus sp.]|nr:leucine-rich repeat protein [Corallococcus sp.]
MKNIKKTAILLLSVMLIAAALGIAACKENVTVTLNYNCNGEIPNKTLTLEEFTASGLGADPVRDGYEFKGWYTQISGGERFTANVVSSSVTVYARWEEISTEEKFVITYNCNGTETTVEVDGGSYTVAECTVKRDGYIFDKYTCNGTDYQAGSVVQVSSDLTFEAVYVRAYTVTFVFNNGTDEKTTQVVKRNEKVTMPQAPEYGGQTFAYWEDALGFSYLAGAQSDQIKADTTFTARWAQPSTVKYNLDGGTVDADTSDQTYATGATVTLPDTLPEKEGYIFVGWQVGANIYESGDSFAMPASDTNVVAKWEKAVKVTFDDNSVERDVEYPYSYVRQGDKATAITPTPRPDHTFAGWFSDPECTMEFVFATSAVNSDVTLYAKWTHVYYRFTPVDTADGKGLLIAGPSLDEARAGKINRDIILTLPERLVIPKSYEGTPVVGITPNVEAFRFLCGDEDSGFTGLSPVRTIVIPNTFTEIADRAFYWCRSVEHYEFEDNGVQIMRIGNEAFYSNVDLLEFTFPSNVVEVGHRVLEFCEKLVSIDMSEINIDEIGECAYYGCHELAEVKFPSTLKKIGAQAFRGCCKISKLELPEGLERIEMGAFGNYSGSETAALSGDLWENYISRKDENGVSYADFTDCYSRLTEITVPSTVTFIGDFAFAWHKNATKLTFAGGGTNLKHIGAYAFYRLEKVTEIKLPDTLEYLGGEVTRNEEGTVTGFVRVDPVYLNSEICRLYGAVFEGCKSLVSIEIPECVQYVIPRMFRNCESLKEVTFKGDDIQFNGSWRAFAGCSALEEFNIAATATLIADETFMDCTRLKKVTFGEGSVLETIYNGVFMNCTSLSEIEIPDSVKNIAGEAFKNCSALTSLRLPTSLVNVGTLSRTNTVDSTWGEVFAGTGITELILPKNVQYVAPYAFANMQKLVTFEMDDDCVLSGFDIRSNTLGLRVSYTFYNCGKLEKIRFGKNFGMTLVGSPYALYAFEGCDSLINFEVSPTSSVMTAVDGVLFTNFTPSASVTGNALVAYPYGRKNTSYIVPDTAGQLPVAQIMYYSFSGNKNLERITFSANVTTVSNYAFYEARNLKYVEFAEGSKLTYIQQGAFAFISTYPKNDAGQYDVKVLPTATPLVSITIRSETPATLSRTTAGMYPFSYSTENPNFAIYVPASSVNAYKQAWAEFAQFIKPIQE